MSRSDNNSIYLIIKKFYKDYKCKKYTLDQVIKIIELFLYKIFVQNIEKSRLLFKNELDISGFISEQDFNNEEKKLINCFIEYECPQKDKAIFNIGSIAIEYI